MNKKKNPLALDLVVKEDAVRSLQARENVKGLGVESFG